MDRVLDIPLPVVDVVGPLDSEKILELLHDAGAPISFIASDVQDPEVHLWRSEPATVRDLLDELLAQNPGYQLEVVSGKIVVYPANEGYDEILEIAARKQKRFVAYFTVQDALALNGFVFHGIRNLRSRRRPTAAFYGDLVSVGGRRTVVEHLISLVADRPSGNIVVRPGEDGSLELATWWAGLIEDFVIEVPGNVEIGMEFQVIPRVTLVDRTMVTLIGAECGVRYETAEADPPINTTGLSIDDFSFEQPEEVDREKEPHSGSLPILVDEPRKTFISRGGAARYEAVEPDPPIDPQGPSSIPEGLRVDSAGRSVAMKTGTFRISARYLGRKASEEVEVIDAHAESQLDLSGNRGNDL